jgi:hypothetical protein
MRISLTGPVPGTSAEKEWREGKEWRISAHKENLKKKKVAAIAILVDPAKK